MKEPDLYEVLGVPSTANPDEIRAAYRESVKKHHPDRFLSPEEKSWATKRMQQVNEAYAILGDYERRKLYDQVRNQQGAAEKRDQRQEKRLTPTEFVIRAIIALREKPSPGIHSVNSGFNEAFRVYFNDDPDKWINKLAAEGVIEVRIAPKGFMLYLPGEAPSRTAINAIAARWLLKARNAAHFVLERRVTLFVHSLILVIALVLGFYHAQDQTIERPYLDGIISGLGIWFGIELLLNLGPALPQLFREILAVEQFRRYRLLVLALTAVIYLSGIAAEISNPWTLWYAAIDYEQGSTDWKRLSRFKIIKDCGDASATLASDELKKRLKAQAGREEISKKVLSGLESMRDLAGKSLIIGIGRSVIEFQMPGSAIPSIIGPWQKRAWSYLCTRGLKYGFLPYFNHPTWDPVDADLRSWGFHEVQANVAKLAEQDTYGHKEAFIAPPSLEKWLEKLERARKTKKKTESKEER